LPSKKLLKEIFIISIITFTFLLGIETLFRLYKVFITRNNSNKYKTEKFYRDLGKAFDNYYSEKEIKVIDKQTRSNIIFVPWIQLGNPELNTKYSVVQNGIRKTYESNNNNCKNNLNIWFFGGSTMFGTGTPWQDSIPSNVSKIMKMKNVCIKAINFGVPSHTLEVEIKNFTNRIYKKGENTPDYVIFMDGVNDIARPGALIRGEPTNTPLIRESLIKTKKNESYKFKFPVKIELELVNYIRRKYKESNIFYRNHEIPYGYNEKQLPEIYVNKFSNSKNFLNKFCKTFDTKCLMFLQPISYLSYPNFRKDELTKTCPGGFYEERYKSIYSALEKKVYEENKFKNINSFSLVSVFKNYQNGIPYVDCAHYSPRGSKIIAEQITAKIFSLMEN